MSYSTIKFSERLAYRTSASDLLPSSSNGFIGVPLKTLESVLLSIPRRDMVVSANLRKVKKINFTSPRDVDPNVEVEDLMHLSSLKKVKPKAVNLEYEKPLMALKKQIIEVRKMAIQTGLDFNDQIISLESNYEQALKKLYMHLTSTHRVTLARNPKKITEKFAEVHGNISGYDDPVSMDKDTTETPKLEQIEELRTLVHSESDLNEKMIEKLEREIGHEYSKAAKALDLKDKLVILYEEFSKTWNSADQILYDPALQDKIKNLNDEFNQNLPQAPNYGKLKFMLDMLKEISQARDLSEDQEIEENFEEIIYPLMKVDELNEENKNSTTASESPFPDGDDQNSTKGNSEP